MNSPSESDPFYLEKNELTLLFNNKEIFHCNVTQPAAARFKLCYENVTFLSNVKKFKPNKR
jgi:hypothetical protein